MSMVLVKKRSRFTTVRPMYLLLLVLPALIWLLVFKYGPMYGLVMAFEDYKFVKGIFGSPWIGLKHFETFLGGSAFPHILKNTVIFSSLNILIGFPAPIILALMLNELYNMKFKKIIQTVSYLPYFVSWIVLAGIIRELLSPTRGVVNDIIESLGGQSIYFLAEPAWFRPVVVFFSVWQQVGWSSIIYLAAIASIDPELYDSAIIDGAGRFKRAIYITLPSIMPTFVIMLLFSVSSLLCAPFDPIFNLMNQMVFEVADIFDTYSIRVGINQMSYSFASAVGFFRNFVGLVLILVSHFISKKIYGRGLF